MDILPSTQVHRFVSTKLPTNRAQFNNSRYLQSNAGVAIKSGELSLTHHLFDEMPLLDTFAWNSLIQTHLIDGNVHHVVSIYQHMLLRGVRPDRHTLPRILTASRLSRNLFVGKQVHGQALKLGFSGDQYVITSLLEMYGRLQSVDTAEWLLHKSPCRNSVSWTLLARLYVEEDKPSLAIHLFHEMVESGTEIDSVALATVIGACATLKSLKQGRNVHQVARKCGLEFDVLVSNSLLKMYIDCGSIEDARATFDRMPSKDIISWTAIIHAYVKKGGINEGLKLFRQMIVEDGLKPDQLSISSILPACARLTENKQGREIHGYLLRNGIVLTVTVTNALIDMYVKSGCINSASKLFTKLRNRDVISWTVMIMGYSLHGLGDVAVDLFQEMEKDSGILIDQMTYGAVLHACSTARLVEEGKFYFNCIKAPEVTHFICMVALLARSGLFDEATNFIQRQKIERNTEVLRALLDGCRIHQESKLGKRVIEQICELESLNAENYVLLSNWYAVNGKWDMVKKLRGMIIDLGLKPKKAYSWIEIRNKIHVFGTGDVSHPRSERIYWELHCLMKKIEDEGYRPCTDYSLHNVDEERECIQVGHSEMLALSFGLISTQASVTIRVTKNLRVCRNCHDCAKFISKIVEREFIFKDPNRFHHFQDGFCSCGDFW
ncbi:hypothetical protein FNV43_RR25612 [Rhamnella rubrinervis]|uniref:DYW domain-containing protein n=1 Tax=Rhamnella rubrinervis TaxID=2594499 RepID=A0A8K0DTI4_9ROSA|nr:hypothetical protein FNV43_RR25612 [Rhamnella rubrinervis]